MDLFEYQGKQYFARFGIPVSPGGVADSVEDAVAQADRVGYPVVVKAQVQVGGRGKAGGIKLAASPEEVRTHAANILGMDIRGHVVHRLWTRAPSRACTSTRSKACARPTRAAWSSWPTWTNRRGPGRWTCCSSCT